MKLYDIAVVGGGASGLMAAVSAAQEASSQKRDCRIVILEGNKKLGKKLLATGNGRCNLTNEALSPERYHGDRAFLPSLLQEYSTDSIRGFFKEIGLLTRADDAGRVYPLNLQAAAVLEVLKNRAEDLGVECRLEFSVFSVLKPGSAFILKSESGEEIRAKSCILACGGMASPKHSCGQEGYAVCRSLGHSVTPLYPALVQLTSKDKFLRNLPGIRCRARVALYGDRAKLAEEAGEVLFADRSLSGICVFQLSLIAAEYFSLGSVGGRDYESMSVAVDFLPEMEEKAVLEFLKSLKENAPNLTAGEFLSGVVNMKVGREIMQACGIQMLDAASSFSEAKLAKICGRLKNTRIAVDGVKGFEDAQITAGGVPLREVQPGTMESRKVRGLYLCGEILNIHGECGGYNLHFAWASGRAAGRAAALQLPERNEN